ncbi:ubiquitin-conjugating enzyme E2 C isoform X2 [Catharus ustulatus]|uniref:ubiquitin-conjugating enzyme E2 C isoform X2 n=1 Tax=Catharus ustulatus TaxID=91951 RepID=UPI00140A4850|nr:ubiquitin-conjugating enzyme E2 C isoform X2 [Catharus ustulatus]
MASQNADPAAVSSAAARKAAETGATAARGAVGKRLQQELMALMVSGAPQSSWDLGILGPSRGLGVPKAPGAELGWGVVLDLPDELSLQMSEPNIESPLNTHAAELWKNQVAYKKYVRETYNKQTKGQET